MGNLNKHLQSFKYSALYKSSEKVLLLYQIKILSNGDSSFLSFSLRVTESLEVDVWLNGIRLISSDFGWLQMQDNKISHWSQLENVLARLHNAEKEAECFEMSDKSLIEHANMFLSRKLLQMPTKNSVPFYQNSCFFPLKILIVEGFVQMLL